MEKLRILEQVDSTNSYVRDHFDELADGTLVVSFDQTAGRGRRDRRWLSPPGRCIAATAVFKNLSDGFHAGCILGVAALDLCRRLVPGLPCFFKWPNDLYVEDRKLAGILCEGVKFAGGRVTGVAAGIGLNVNLTAAELQQFELPATGIGAEAERQFNLVFLSKKLAESVNRYYIKYSRCQKTVLDRWRQENLLVGECITVTDAAGRSRSGRFREIAGDGRMILTAGDGEFVFSCGDVRIDRNAIDWNIIKNKVPKI